MKPGVAQTAHKTGYQKIAYQKTSYLEETET